MGMVLLRIKLCEFYFPICFKLTCDSIFIEVFMLYNLIINKFIFSHILGIRYQMEIIINTQMELKTGKFYYFIYFVYLFFINEYILFF